MSYFRERVIYLSMLSAESIVSFEENASLGSKNVFAAYPSTPLSSSPLMVPKQLKRSIPTYPQIYTLHLSCHSLLSQHPHSPCFLPPLPPCSLSRCIHRRLSLQYLQSSINTSPFRDIDSGRSPQSLPAKITPHNSSIFSATLVECSTIIARKSIQGYYIG